MVSGSNVTVRENRKTLSINKMTKSEHLKRQPLMPTTRERYFVVDLATKKFRT